MNRKLILRRLSFLALAVLVATASAAVFAGDVSALAEKPRNSEPFATGDAGAALNSYTREIIQRLPAAPGATINVPYDYATIQAAIDAAVTGDIIVVAAGTYPEAITIDGKDLTITGAGAGSSIITGDVLNTTHIVFITGGAIVDFSGFTVDGTGKSIKYGIYAFTGTDGDIHDNDVINIAYPGAAGLAVRRSDSYIDVTNNMISGFGRIGIYTRDEIILNTDTGVISGNTVTGLGGADPDRLSYGISCYYGNPTISGNHVYDCVSGANVSSWASSGMDLWNGGTPAVTGNDIHDSEIGIMVLNCSPVLSGNTFYGIADDDVRIDLIVKGNPTAHWAEWYNTIQEAVDAAPVSSYNTLVWVACYSGAGIYEEQVVIDQNLKMYGNYESTVIVSPDDLVAKFTTSVDNYPVVYVHDADDVVIDGLVVDGEGKGNANYRFVGIGYRNAGGTVNDVDILNIQDTPFSGAQHGVAMYLYNDDSTAREFQLYNCGMTGFQKNAVALNASSTTALAVDVQGNNITGAGATTVTAQNGIQVSGDLITGTIAGNIIDGIAYDNTSATTKWVATSILNYYANVEIAGNTVTGAHLGVYHYFGHGPVTGNDLTIEKIGVFAYGVVTADPPEVIPSPFDQLEGPVGSSRALLGAPLADVDVNVSSNTIVFSGTDNTDTYGISVEAGYDADNVTAVVDDNTVTGFGTGIEFWSCTSDCGTGLFTEIDAHGNSITGNATGMFSNADYLTADATANWWGHSSGPYHATLNPDGLGDDVSDYILFEPFTQPVISVSPAYDITTCSVSKTFSFLYDGTDVPEQLRGYEVTFTVDPSVATVAAIGTDIVEGGFLDAFGDGQFFALDSGGGTYKINCAILGGSVGATGSGELFSVKLTPVAEGTSAITITGIKLRDVDNVPMAGSFTGASLQVDCTVPTMEALAEAQGQYYNAAPVFSNFGFDDDVNLDTAEYQVDSGGWTALFAGIDAAEWNSDGWTLPGFDALAQGTHTVYFRVSDDAGNVNGEGTPDTYSWQFYKDTILPAPPTNFTARPGHNKVHLTWTNPPSDPSLAGVEIRRVGWSDYPEYGTGSPVIAAPAYPADESEGAFVTQTLLGAYDDASMTHRDIYYYAAFAYDIAGNYSVFDIGAADRSTSYWLGDVDSTGYVNMSDLVYFSNTFGEGDADPGWDPFCDFGPTDDWSSFGIPLPDDIVDFEDLMIFSMIYNNVGPLGSPAPIMAERELEDLAGLVGFDIASAASGDGIVISVTLSNNAKTLKGFRLVLDAGETGRIVGVEPGSIFSGRSDLFFGSVPASEGRADISVAALGIGRELKGSGEVAKIHVRLEEGARADVRFETIDVRDVANTRFELLNGDDHELPFVPVVTSLMQNYPNPFNPVTTISFDVARAGRVVINVYGVSGALIRTLVDDYAEPGRYDIEWDGRDNNGSRVSSGVYFYRMKTADYNSTRKMILLR